MTLGIDGVYTERERRGKHKKESFCYRCLMMGNEGSTYRHYIPALDLSIERYTNRVPADGKFHLVYKGNIVGSFRLKRQAEHKFYHMVKESGYKPDTSTTEPIDPSEEGLERYFQSKAVFWAEGPIRRDKGGKGGRGGV